MADQTTATNEGGNNEQLEASTTDSQMVLTGGNHSECRDSEIGFLYIRPRCCLVSMLPFSLWSGVLNIFTSTLTLYLASQITTLEKQFGLSSKESGLLMSMNEFGFFTTVLFITYFARNWHIPRILAFSGVLYGVAALVCIIPHFGRTKASTNFPNISAQTGLCMSMNDSAWDNTTGTGDHLDQQSSMKDLAFNLIAIGMFLQGVTKSPRTTLNQTYVDDNVPKSSTGIYLGIMSALAVFGPAVAFGLGAVSGNIYVTLEDTNMTPSDPRWIGSWWLGFLVFGVTAAVLAIPLCFFPKRLSNNVKGEKSLEVLSGGFWGKVKDAPRSVLRLITCPVYILTTVALCLKMLTLAGFITFAPKFLQLHFGISNTKANILMGAITVAAVSSGIFLGGTIASKLRLQLKGCLGFTVLCHVVSSSIFLIGMFLACPQPHVEGLQSRIHSVNLQSVHTIFIPTCNASCTCNDDYFPVCGSDDVSYYSPCEAGCRSESIHGYDDCLCISNTTDGSPFSVSSAVPGLCEHECSFLIPYVIINFLTNFISGLSVTPATIILIRSVTEKDKAFALGFFGFVSSVLGWSLGPIIAGSFIDTTCLLWHTSGSLTGACAVYDITDLRMKIHGMDAVGSLIYITIFLVALIYVIFGNSKKLEITKSEKSETVSSEM